MITGSYERHKQLRVRKQPSTDAEIVRYIERGGTFEVLEVSDGWCKISDGYVMEGLVALTDDGDEAAEQTEPPATDEGEADDGATDDGAADDGEPEATTDDGDEAAELRKMTNPQLYDLCVKSGIKVKKNASKDTMIAALINPDA